MSHRIYLYNAARIEAAGGKDRMLLEWNYEMPPMLHPLLSAPAMVARNHYNNDAPDDIGLFYDASAGVAALRRFHDFLARHPVLVRDPDAFSTARERLSDCLDALPHTRLHLDLWDVLSMDDAPHAVQIEHWRDGLAHNNRIIEAAIAADDPKQLLYADLAMLTPGFDDFAALIAHPGYDYGAAALCDWAEPDADMPEVFEHGGRHGLRDANGTVLQPAEYDEIFDFDAHGFCVASRDGRYLHFDHRGQIRGGRDWDDAYDFDGDRALSIVRDGAGYGAIALDGSWAIEPRYEDLTLLESSPTRYAATYNGKCGVLDCTGNTLVPFAYENAFASRDGLLHSTLAGSRQSAVFTIDGARITDADIRCVATVCAPAPCHSPGWIHVRRHNRFPASRLYALGGRVIVEGIEPIAPGDAMPDLLLVRHDGRHGAVDRGRLRLPFEFDLLRDLRGEHRGDTVELLLAERDGCRGVLGVDAGSEQWLVAPGAWHDIAWLHSGQVFALRDEDGWRLSGREGWMLPAVRFERIALSPGSPWIYGLVDGRPWQVRCEGSPFTSAALAPLDAPEIELGRAVFEYTDPMVRRHLVAHGLDCRVDDAAVDAFLADPVEHLLHRAAGLRTGAR